MERERSIDDNRGVKTAAGDQVEPDSRRSLEHWLLLSVAIAGVAALVVLGFLVEPDPRGFGTHEKLGLPPCRTIQWWGIPCPGCGVTTSVALVAHGRPLDAFLVQPFGLVSVAGVVVIAAWALAGVVRGRDLGEDLRARNLRAAGWTVAAAMLAAWIYKIALVRGWIG